MNVQRLAVLGVIGIGIYAYHLGEQPQTTVTGGSLNAAKVPAAYVKLIDKAATTCSVLSAPLLAAQFYQESGFNPKAVSGTGAEGITQFEPGTWTTWASPSYGDGLENPFNPADEIPAAARFDCALAKQLANVPGNPVDNMLAGYNAGAKAVLDDNGIPDNGQTPNYVDSINALEARFTLAHATPTTTTTTPAPHNPILREINGITELIGDVK